MDDLQYKEIPITSVRIRRIRTRFWLIEYQREPQFFIDGLWWFNDSFHSEFADAAARLETLVKRKTYKQLSSTITQKVTPDVA